jgi:hypothetical protein
MATSEGKYYVQKDVKGFMQDGNDFYGTLYRGESIECTMQGGKCCFETEPGTVCIDATHLSKTKIASRDIFIKKIYAATADSEKGACTSKNNVNPDAFTWSYGVELGGDAKAAVVMATFFIEKGNTIVYTPALHKLLKVKNVKSNNCVEINISRNDIKNFLREYSQESTFLNVEQDLNVGVKGIFQVFTPAYENNLKNNKAVVEATFPADTEENWPDK